MTNPSRGLGWKPDPVQPVLDRVDHDAAALLVTAPPVLPTATDLRHLVVEILDQGQLGSCVANAGMQAIRMAHRAQTIADPTVPPLGSRLFGYYWARAFSGDVNRDEGTHLRDFFRGIAKYGFCPEAFWPYSDVRGVNARFCRLPGGNALRMAYDQHGGDFGYARIYDDTPAGRLTAIRQAVAAGYAVVFGTLVSETFCIGVGSVAVRAPTQKSDVIAGGHALTIVGYGADGTFTVANSWGPAWGVDGYCYFAPEYVSWEKSQDFWIVKNPPRFTAV